jgi:hypothetical protein
MNPHRDNMWGLIGGNVGNEEHLLRRNNNPQPHHQPQQPMPSKTPQLPLLVTQREDTPTKQQHGPSQPQNDREMSPLSVYRNLRRNEHGEEVKQIQPPQQLEPNPKHIPTKLPKAYLAHPDSNFKEINSNSASPNIPEQQVVTQFIKEVKNYRV